MKRISALLLILFLVSCSKVPLTGRRQAAFIPSGQLNSLSTNSYRQTISESRLSTNQQQVQMVRKVGNDIAMAVEKYLKENGYEDMIKDFSWEFNLIDDPSVNAWCMPGGKVAFYTGILPICKDETGIAVVMGHEIAHAVAKHGNERMTQGLAQQGLGMGLQLALRDQPAQTQSIFMTAFGVTSAVGVMLPFSRKHESEADRMGLKFMAMAGYDPKEAPKFWERMAGMSKGASAAPTTAQSWKEVEKNVNAQGGVSLNLTPSNQQAKPTAQNQKQSQQPMISKSDKKSGEAVSLSLQPTNQQATDNKANAGGSNNGMMSQNRSNFDTQAFMSTHPSHDKRISDLNKWMPEALKFYKP